MVGLPRRVDKKLPLQAVCVIWAICLRVGRRPKEPHIVPENGPRRLESGLLQLPLALSNSSAMKNCRKGRQGGFHLFSRGAPAFCTCLEVLREARRKMELFCHMESRSPSQLILLLAGKQPQRPLREGIKAFPKHQTNFSRQAACSGQKSPWTQQGY